MNVNYVQASNFEHLLFDRCTIYQFIQNIECVGIDKPSKTEKGNISVSLFEPLAGIEPATY